VAEAIAANRRGMPAFSLLPPQQPAERSKPNVDNVTSGSPVPAEDHPAMPRFIHYEALDRKLQHTFIWISIQEAWLKNKQRLIIEFGIGKDSRKKVNQHRHW
jgi:hypothetical protein